VNEKKGRETSKLMKAEGHQWQTRPGPRNGGHIKRTHQEVKNQEIKKRAEKTRTSLTEGNKREAMKQAGE